VKKEEMKKIVLSIQALTANTSTSNINLTSKFHRITNSTSILLLLRKERSFSRVAFDFVFHA